MNQLETFVNVSRLLRFDGHFEWQNNVHCFAFFSCQMNVQLTCIYKLMPVVLMLKREFIVSFFLLLIEFLDHLSGQNAPASFLRKALPQACEAPRGRCRTKSIYLGREPSRCVRELARPHCMNSSALHGLLHAGPFCYQTVRNPGTGSGPGCVWWTVLKEQTETKKPRLAGLSGVI